MINESRPSDYVAAINHELRTPLNVILGFSDLLSCAEALSEPHRRYAANIQASGKRLLVLIEEILELARRAKTTEMSVAGPLSKASGGASITQEAGS